MEEPHVYFVNLFGVILLLAPLLLASGCSVVRFFLQQVPRAVIDRDDLRGNLLGLRVFFRRAGEFQFAQDLPPDCFDPLPHKLIHIEGAAGRQGEGHGGQIQGKEHTQEIAAHGRGCKKNHAQSETPNRPSLRLPLLQKGLGISRFVEVCKED